MPGPHSSSTTTRAPGSPNSRTFAATADDVAHTRAPESARTPASRSACARLPGSISGTATIPAARAPKNASG